MEKRKTSLDILRIIAMYFIILGHFLIYRQNGLILASEGLPFIKSSGDYLSVLLMGIAIVGTNLFFLLSGYFGIRFKIIKFIDICCTTFFYGSVIGIILFLVGDIQLITFVKNTFLIFDKYWFIEVYLVVMLVSAVMNEFISNATKKELNTIIIIGFIVFCIYGFFHECTRIGVSRGWSLIWALYLYLVGAWIKKNQEVSIKKSSWVYFLSTFSYLFLVIILSLIERVDLFWKYGIAYNNPFVFISSVSLFFIFQSFKNREKSAKMNKVIRVLASTTIGVYMIHTAPGLNLFQRINISLETVNGRIIFIIIALFGSLFIYIICSIVDFIRQRTIGTAVKNIMNKILIGINAKRDINE